MDTQTLKDNPYSFLNIKKETRQRIDEYYYKNKLKNKYKSYDDFIKELLDLLDIKKDGD
jgi:hypothetical protein